MDDSATTGPTFPPSGEPPSGPPYAWQDLAKTVPAVLPGDPVRVLECPHLGHRLVAPSDLPPPTLAGGGWVEFAAFDDADTPHVVTG